MVSHMAAARAAAGQPARAFKRPVSKVRRQPHVNRSSLPVVMWEGSSSARCIDGTLWPLLSSGMGSSNRPVLT